MAYLSKQAAINLLKELINIPSFSKTEDQAVDCLQHNCNLLGLESVRKGNNLIVTSPYYNPTQPTILLNSHIDTVRPVNGWQRDPFTPTQEQLRLYGLGANDAGASLVSLLSVYSQLIETKQPYNLLFVAAAEEEISGVNGISSLLPSLPNIDLAIVGEPTQMQVAVAEKGLLVLDCEAIGKAGHAARNQGENAIYKAIRDIEWLRGYQFEKESPYLGPIKMTVTQIEAGVGHNVIPDRCKFVVDIRSTDCYSNEEIYNIIAPQLQSVCTARSFRLNPSGISELHPIVVRAKEMGLETFGSPTLSDQTHLSCPSIKLGPGDSNRSHTADEYIYTHEIEEAIDRYIDLLDGLTL